MYRIDKQRRKRRRLPSLLIAAALLGYVGWALGRPLDSLQPDAALTHRQVQSEAGQLQWPSVGQAAVGIVGSNYSETHGSQKAAATASTAKIITALVILEQKPLGLNQAGPTISLTAADVERYKAYVARDGSVVPVKEGEQITQYQMLQGILLPSSNNMADSLAIWAFGSLEAYAKAANTYLAKHKLSATHVGSDASGLAPDSVSTALDLVRLGELAMDNPVMAQIVRQTMATGIPIAGTVKNVNSLLGTSGIIGVKTGNSDEAGGDFVAAANVTVDNKNEIIVTAVMNAPSLFVAMKDSLTLVKSAQDNFQPLPVIKVGDIVGYYSLPWGGKISAIATKDVTLTIWKGSSVAVNTSLDTIPTNTQAGAEVGTLTANLAAPKGQKSIAIKLLTTPSKPTISWRLTHPF